AFRRYLRLRIHVHPLLQEYPPEKPVVIAVHPHGVASDYRILLDGMFYNALPKREVLTLSASVLFCIPMVRELALWTRCIDARKSVAARALKKKHSLMVIPGGEQEQIRTVQGREEVFLRKRFGFIKLALEQQAAVVPCYAFGCVDLYATYTNFLFSPREYLRKTLGVCIPVYLGALGFLPLRKPVHLVCGAPLELSCKVPGKPTDEEVVTDRWQKWTDLEVTEDTLMELSKHCDEFLVHGVDVEGLQSGIEEPLVQILAMSPIPVTYAGGVRSLEACIGLSLFLCGTT
ncbi:Diacylglycerol O-acyltransferase 1 (Diglyceride acyltransferase) (Triacylglycerol synthase) (TAG synthase), partial [Durusdinium trenchii]